jgi:hypothetical protein
MPVGFCGWIFRSRHQPSTSWQLHEDGSAQNYRAAVPTRPPRRGDRVTAVPLTHVAAFAHGS